MGDTWSQRTHYHLYFLYFTSHLRKTLPCFLNHIVAHGLREGQNEREVSAKFCNVWVSVRNRASIRSYLCNFLHIKWTGKVLLYIQWVNECQSMFCFSSCVFLLFEHLRLGISLQACLLQIVGYRNLIADVEKLRREPYDSDNPQHEEMLLKVSPRAHSKPLLGSANVRYAPAVW